MDVKHDKPKMDWDSKDLYSAFKRIRDHAEFMFKGPLANKEEEVQCNYLMLWIGETGRQIFSTWTLTNDEKKKLKTYYDKFNEYCKPKSNVIYNRYLFRSRTQTESEPFEQFVTELKTLIRDCNYPAEFRNEMVRDHIVYGVRSSKIREKMIMEGSELTLEKCLDIAHTYELSQAQAEAIGTQVTPKAVDALYSARGRSRFRTRGRRRFTSQARQTDSRQGRDNQRVLTTPKCQNCGNHKHSNMGQCPAKGKLCHKCSKYNHFAKVCKSVKLVHEVVNCENYSDNYSDYSDSDEQEFYVHTVNSFSSQPDQVFVTLSIGTFSKCMDIDCKIDTGSQINCLPNSTFKRLKISNPLEPSNATLTAYTGDQLTVRGKINLTCAYKNKSVNTDFYIVESTAPPLLSLKTSLDLGLIQLTHSIDRTENYLDKTAILKQYKDLFDGIGQLSGTCSLHLKENAIPVVCPPRKVPFGLQDKLKEELDSMESKQIICKVTEPTSWVNSLVCVEKPNGKIRICLDPKALNDTIRRPHYPMRSIDDITAKLAGAKYFSVLDATKGYWSICLDQESSFLTTFNTPFGRYRYLRLPMGIRSSQDIFQRKVDEMLEGLLGVTSICDDILVFGRTRAEHDSNLEKVLQKSRDSGLRFNPDKIQIGCTQVRYYGHVISSEGLKVCPDKVTAILNMPTPANRAELETLLGMITYLTKFQPNLAEITSPMRELLRKDVEFRWDSAQTEAFHKLKTALTQSPILSYYDPKKPVRLQVDASSKGLGVCCLQDGKPIAYASKTLTPTEILYAQVEKEMLAIVFGCVRFKNYIWRRHTVIESDCKPIESIMKKPLCSAPPRLQRLLLQIQHYDLEIVHVRGKNLHLGDALSRNYVSETYPDLIEGLDAHVHTVIRSLPISDVKIKQIQEATRNDGQLQTLTNVIRTGWPENRQDCPKSVTEYWNHRDELSSANDIVFKGQKLVIPTAMRKDMIKAVHIGHFGVEKSVGRARDIMFWPLMSKHITEYVQSCAICNKHKDSNSKEPLHPHDVPQRPWQNLSLDLFTWKNQEFMVLVDAYSRYFEFDLIPNTRSVTIIRKLKVHFSRFGICEKLKTDGAAYFTSEQFQRFLSDWNIKHETSSPTHASSNGLSEVYVKIAKRILQKSKDDNRDPYLPLLEYRNTPLKCGYSPAQLLMGRRLRSILPSTNKQLMPKTVDPNKARKKMTEQQNKTKQHYDKTARKLPPLKVGEPVHIQRDKFWEPAKVVSQHNEHSFKVRTPEGATYRRNRKFLNKTPQLTFSQDTPTTQIRTAPLNDPPNSTVKYKILGQM